MLAMSAEGCLIFRNNVGAYKIEDRFIKYGVGGEGASDLIGSTPVIITQEMVGKKIGVFTAIETKNATRKPTEKQLNFINVIIEQGGIAGIARSVEDAILLLARK